MLSMSVLFPNNKNNENNQKTNQEETAIAQARKLIEGKPFDQIGALLWDENFPTRIIAYILNLSSVEDFRKNINSCLTVDEIINTTTIHKLKTLLRMGYIRNHGRNKDLLFAYGKFEDAIWER